MLRISWVPLVVTLAVPAWGQSAALDTCEPLRERIEANIASKGLAGFSVTVVDADASAPGDQVGTCGNGSRKIMYLKKAGVQAPVAAPPKAKSSAAAPSAGEKPKPASKAAILTECKDGTVSMGGDCKP